MKKKSVLENMFGYSAVHDAVRGAVDGLVILGIIEVILIVVQWIKTGHWGGQAL